MQQLKVGVVQMGSLLGEAGPNLVRMEIFASQALERGAGFVCFPEACVTGYTTQNAHDVAIDADDGLLLAFEDHMTQQGVAVSYGFVERGRAGLHITHVVSDGKARLVYRKTHLGSREQGVFVPGEDLPVKRIAGVTVGVQLCWESHLPDISTVMRAKGAELFLMPYASGAGGARRHETWERYLPARAYDNGCCVLACNALHTLGNGAVKGGGICICGPDGAVLKDYYGSDERVVVCELGGPLPREVEPDGMRNISYFDKRRPELYGQGRP